jgi:hypothetical protein
MADFVPPSAEAPAPSEPAPTTSDDASQATLNIRITSVVKPDPFIEKCIKFTFRVADNDEASSVSMGHFLVLKAIYDAFGDEVRIYNNQNERLHKFKLPSHVAYMRHFTMRHRQQNQRLKRKATYQVFHRIQTTVALSSIRKQQQVRDLLTTYHGNLSFHAWSEDVTDVVSLGFFTGVDPTNYLSQDYESSISTELMHGIGARGGIPKFKVIMSSPSANLSVKTRLRTKSYDLQVERKDAKAMSDILQKTYHDKPKFIFYRMRYANEKAFNNAIRAQNVFLNQTMTVPLIGVPPDSMFYMENHILAIPGVTQVLRHRHTPDKGRYNVQTTQTHFKSVVATLKRQLNTLINDTFSETIDIPDHEEFPEPSVMIRDDDHSDTDSISSYFSSCSDAFSLYDAAEASEADAPPPETTPATQAWGKPLMKALTVSDVTTNTFSAVSDLSSPVELELKALKEANLNLTANNNSIMQELRELRQQFASLIQPSAPIAPLPPVPSPASTIPQYTPDELETTLISLIERVLSQQQSPEPRAPSTPERPPGAKRRNQNTTPNRDSLMSETLGPSEEDSAAVDNDL